MKPFLLELLPWTVAVVSLICALLSYLMYLRVEEQAKKLYQHWRERHELNLTACHHIKQLEDDLKRALDADHSDDGELWKNL